MKPETVSMRRHYARAIRELHEVPASRVLAAAERLRAESHAWDLALREIQGIAYATLREAGWTKAAIGQAAGCDVRTLEHYAGLLTDAAPLRLRRVAGGGADDSAAPPAP